MQRARILLMQRCWAAAWALLCGPPKGPQWPVRLAGRWWSRSFGTQRQSKFAGAYPILQGLTLMVGFGVVFPAGTYDASDLTAQALSIGTNIWDFAPTIAATYTTPPILAEGTEISAKFY